MAEPSAEPPPSQSNEQQQLITPLLTPVSEEFPDDLYTSLDLHGLPGQRTARTPRLPEPSTGDSRNRSISLPVGLPDETPQANGSIASRRLTTAEPSSSAAKQATRREVLKLSSAQIQELTSAPGSLPVRSATFSDHERSVPRPNGLASSQNQPLQINSHGSDEDVFHSEDDEQGDGSAAQRSLLTVPNGNPTSHRGINGEGASRKASNGRLPYENTKIAEIPPWRLSTPEHQSSAEAVGGRGSRPNVSRGTSNSKAPALLNPLPSPLLDSLPIPPFSMPTHLHLELSSDRPSPLYIHRPTSADIPYEPTSVKFERLLNFLLLPPLLERVLFFGALTCLDAWLYTFTILPLRFLKAAGILIEWAAGSVWREICYLADFVYNGLGRLWHRRLELNRQGKSTSRRASEASNAADAAPALDANGTVSASISHPNDPLKRHQRRRSVPSLLQPNHKADLLQGALITVSCMILLKFDASRIYHGIRVQGAIKLYVIYNVLEVFDRLLSALGQDIIECLFSAETLERKPNGRSKIIKPFWMFLLALIYTVVHATAFFYQVITLNVAVNSYSNALLTLLMSNQFVEIKGTVFKRFEKENLFQLTCADVVERFQLWLILVIIALRNIVELGGLSVGTDDFTKSFGGGGSSINGTSESFGGTFDFLPTSFTILPSLFPAQVLGPFLIVLGSEMVVDWVKHAYITKFNATSPALYARFFDVLAKDYYANAFATQNLVRRLGLPTIPLACLFIRSIMQTYHMFLATNFSSLGAGHTSTASSLSLNSDPTASPALAQIDHIFRSALGRSSFGGGSSSSGSGASNGTTWWNWSLDDAIAITTMLVFFLALYLLLLAAKLILGMLLLGIARQRYSGMKKREHERVVETKGSRHGAWGTVEVGEERRRWIYDGDPDGLKKIRDKEAKAREKEKDAWEKGKMDRLESVDRYRMVGKRIW